MPLSDADRDLLARHLPELRYHPLEAYRADSPATFTDAFLKDAYTNELWSRDKRRLIARARGAQQQALGLTLQLLGPAGERYWPGGPKASENDFLRAHPGTLQRDSQAMHACPGYGHRVYCRIAPPKGELRWLQYWFFYYDNPFAVAFVGAHQGDWEMIQVAVDSKDTPQAVTYAQHGEPRAREWSDVPTADADRDVPIVYVAKGSHASYFAAREHRRLPWALGRANDHTADGGERKRPDPHYLDPERDRWLAWPGRWGSTWDAWYEGRDRSPQGPAFQTPYKDPQAFHDRPEARGAEAALEVAEPAAVPQAPETLSTRVEGDVLLVEYELPLRPPDEGSAPTRLELAVYGSTGPPAVGSYDITGVNGIVRQALPAALGPYRLQAGVYDEEDNERLLGAIDLGGTAAPVRLPEQAALDAAGVAAEAAAPPPRRRIAAARQPRAGELRIVVRAPEGGADEVAELVRRAMSLDPAARWRVVPLFGEDDPSAEPELRRWFAVIGPAPDLPGSDLAAAAFEAGRALGLDDGWVVEPDVVSTVFVPDPPGDPEHDEGAALAEDDDHDWALSAIRAQAAWDLKPQPGGTARGKGIVIGQPDTGYTDHPELEPGTDDYPSALDRLRDFDVLTGRDDAHAVLAGAPPFRFPSHGTGTASVAVSRDVGTIKGSAPLAVVLPIRAAVTVAHVANGDLACAVDYARRTGSHVISISMGGLAYPGALRVAIRRAVEEGIIVMAAAGQPLPVVVEPARFPECLGVGGTTRADTFWWMSARGSEVDVSAPASKVWVAATENDGSFHCARHSGTSFSVALVAGAAAVWLGHHGRRSIVDAYGPKLQAVFRSLVRSTARVPPGWDTANHGAGILNLEALLGAPLPEPADFPDPSATLAATEEQPDDPADWALARAGELAPAGVAPDEARARLEALFEGDRAQLSSFGREVVYRLAEGPATRAAVLAPPDSAAALEAAPPGLASLEAFASPSLRAALSGRRRSDG